MEIDELRKHFMEGHLPGAYPGERLNFVESIKAKGPGAVIAEFKPASPSKGVLRENVNMIALGKKLGFKIKKHEDEGEYELSMTFGK